MTRESALPAAEPADVLARAQQLARAGRLLEARGLLEGALGEAERTADEPRALDLASTLASIALETGDFDAALKNATRVSVLARGLGAVSLGGVGDALAGKALVLAGQVEAGLERLLEGLSAARAGGDPLWELSSLLLWGESLLAVGRLEEAQGALAAAQALAAAGGVAVPGDRLARLEAALAIRERRPEADALAAELLAMARRSDNRLALAHALRWRAEWLAWSGAPQAGSVWLEAASEAARAAMAPLLQDLASRFDAGMQASQGDDPYRKLVVSLPRLDSGQGVDALANAAVDTFLSLIDAERAFLLLFDGFRLTLRLGKGHATPEAGEFSTSLAYQVLWSRAPVLVDNMLPPAERAVADSLARLGIVSALGVPMESGGAIVGVLLADSRADRPPFSSAELAIARAFADHLGPQVVAAQQLQAARTEHRDAVDLRQLAVAAARARSLDELMRLAVPSIAARLGAERVVIVLDPRRTVGYDADGSPIATPGPISQGVVEWVQDHQQALFLLDVEANEQFGQRASLRALGTTMVAATPLVSDGRLLGVLYADSAKAVPEVPQVAGLLNDVGLVLGAFLARQAPGSPGRSNSQTAWNAGSASQA